MKEGEGKVTRPNLKCHEHHTYVLYILCITSDEERALNILQWLLSATSIGCLEIYAFKLCTQRWA